MTHDGTERNWEIIGLTPDNYVVLKEDGAPQRGTFERPSEFWGITYLTRKERGILRKGLTAAGNDRKEPKT